MTSRNRAFIELLLVAAIWSFASVVIKFTLEGITTIPFLTIRFGISSLIALLVLRKIKALFTHSRTVTILVILYGLLSTTFALGALFLGLQGSTVLTLSIVQALSPVLLMMVAGYLFKEHHTTRVKVGGAIALFGTFITLLNPLLSANAITGSLLGNIFFGLYIAADIASILILKKLMKLKIDAWALTHFSFIAGFVSILPFLAFSPGAISELQNIGSLSPIYWAGIVYMAVFSGTVAYSLRAKAQKTLSVSDTSLFGYLVPIGSSILAVILLRETVDLPFVVGSLFVAAGVLLAEHKKSKKKRLKH